MNRPLGNEAGCRKAVARTPATRNDFLIRLIRYTMRSLLANVLPARRTTDDASYLPSGSAAGFAPAGRSPRSSNAVMVALKVTVPLLPRSAVMERLPIAR